MATENNRTVKLCIAVLLTFAMFWLLSRHITISEILVTFRQIPFLLIVFGFFIFGLSHAIRALRFTVLLNHAQPYHTVFQVTCMHNILLQVLPFRLGEFSFLYFFKKRGLKLTSSLSALAVGRLFDLLALSAYFLLGLWILRDVLPPMVQGVAKYAIILLVALIAITYIVVIHLRKILEKIKAKGALVRKIMEKIHELLDGIELLKKSRRTAQIVLLSLGIWGLQFLWSWVVFREMLQANFWGIIVGTSLPIISTALPIQGMAAFGTFEGVWTIVFLAFGIEKTVAIASGFAFHILGLLYSAALGVWGAMEFFWKQSNSIKSKRPRE